jgi:pimeloyl-ACP methyl ester carboxylesterase
MATTQSITLPDGRILAYDIHGADGGRPLFYFHGAPSARVEAEFFDLPRVADSLGIHLIAPDRPGLGFSDYQPGRRVLDWPADVLALADHLGFERFAVLGYSGGGPYALACARMLPERLTSVTLVSSTGPHDVPGLTDGINPNSLRFMRMSVERPRLNRLIARIMSLTARLAPERFAAQAISSLPDPDARFMSAEGRSTSFARLVRESARQGGRGPQHDTALMVSRWDIDLESIEIPVQIWHGEEDRNAPLRTMER